MKYDYCDNIEMERRLLLHKYLYSQERCAVKVTGAKYKHIQKLHRYEQRSMGK